MARAVAPETEGVALRKCGWSWGLSRDIVGAGARIVGQVAGHRAGEDSWPRPLSPGMGEIRENVGLTVAHLQMSTLSQNHIHALIWTFPPSQPTETLSP